MFIKYPIEEGAIGQHLWDWATNHKTVVILNGGYSSAISELCNFFEHEDNPYPWSHFNESDEALDGALTTVGIVLPEKIYEISAYLRSLSHHSHDEVIRLCYNSGNFDVTTENANSMTSYDVSTWEMDLIQQLNNYGLAK